MERAHDIKGKVIEYYKRYGNKATAAGCAAKLRCSLSVVYYWLAKMNVAKTTKREMPNKIIAVKKHQKAIVSFCDPSSPKIRVKHKINKTIVVSRPKKLRTPVHTNVKRKMEDFLL